MRYTWKPANCLNGKIWLTLSKENFDLGLFADTRYSRDGHIRLLIFPVEIKSPRPTLRGEGLENHFELSPVFPPLLWGA